MFVGYALVTQINTHLQLLVPFPGAYFMDLEEQDAQTPKQLYPNQKYPVDGQVFKNLIECQPYLAADESTSCQCAECFSCSRWRYWHKYGSHHAGCLG